MRRYDWRPDLPDVRDHRPVRLALPALPPHVDLRPGCSPVEDQGQLGSCTAHAIAGALEYLELKAKAPLVRASRLFIYYQERKLEGTVGTDSGAMIRDGVKACNKTGWCNETLWPYSIGRFNKNPLPICYTDAAKRRISGYQRVTDVPTLKNELASGYPVIFGFSVYDSFESDAVAKTGIVPMPGPSEQLLGGHAVLAVGYDDATQRAIVRNSWGTNWGQAGYFTIPYAYLSNRNLSDDFWTISK